MSSEAAIVIGLGMVAFIMKEFSFRLSDHENEWMQRLGFFLGFVSLFYVNFVMYTVLKVAQNSLSYVMTGTMSVALQVMIWTTVIILMVFSLYIFFQVISFMYSFGKGFGKRERD